MAVSIGNLTITSYCAKNLEHVRFKLEIVKDKYIRKFVSKNIGDELKENGNIENVELGNSYIIEDNNKPIGYIHIEKVPREVGVVELRYAVHPEYRRLGYLGCSTDKRKGYGQQILEECRDYLLTFTDVASVELDIRVDNQISRSCAEKAKYQFLGLEPDHNYYIYRASRKDNDYENKIR